MIWQDVLLMMGGFGFSIALIPTIRSVSKPAKTTSLTTGLILIAFCVAYSTLGLWLAFGATLVTATLWFVLLSQKIKQELA